MTPLYSRDLFFVHENPEMFSICCVTHSNFLLHFLSGIFQESVLSREHWLDAAALLQSGVLLLLISSFHFRDKRWELLKHMKAQLLAKWEFPKTLTCTILLVSSVFKCLSPWERLPQMPWRVVHAEACTPASGTQWLITSEPAAISSTWAIRLHRFQWYVRKKDADTVLAHKAKLLAWVTRAESSAEITACTKHAVPQQHFTGFLKAKLRAEHVQHQHWYLGSAACPGRAEWEGGNTAQHPWGYYIYVLLYHSLAPMTSEILWVTFFFCLSPVGLMFFGSCWVFRFVFSFFFKQFLQCFRILQGSSCHTGVTRNKYMPTVCLQNFQD